LASSGTGYGRCRERFSAAHAPHSPHVYGCAPPGWEQRWHDDGWRHHADRYNGHEEFEQKQNLARLFASLREYIHTANLKLTHNTLEVLEYMCDRFEGGADKKEVKRELIGNPRFKDRFGDPLKDNSYSYALATWLAAMKEMITDPDSEWYGTPTARSILNAASKREKKEKAQPVAAGLRLAAPMTEIIAVATQQ
jgi:hypothetical protein